MKIACLVLAAGGSARFGEDKLRYPIKGEPMGMRTLHLYEEGDFCLRMLVTVREKAYLWQEADKLGYQILFNDHPEEGQSRSLRQGIESILGKITPDGVLCSVADQPLLSQDTIQSLLSAFILHPQSIVAPAAEGKRGNPVIFPGALLKELTMVV